jgi:hypothetical protein
MHETIIDTPHLTTPNLRELRELGVRSVFRYYVPEGFRSKFANKRLTRAEAEEIAGHGMTVLAVHQRNSRDIADFDGDAGTQDAQSALKNADDVGQPQGSAIYFSVDFDCYPPQLFPRVEAYFGQINNELNGRYTVGVYGSGGVCGMLEKRGLAQHLWIPKSMGWYGTREALKKESGWTIFQNRHDVTLGNGFAYDTNQVNPGRTDIGDFTPNGMDAPDGVAEAHAAMSKPLYEVIVREGANLRRGPGKDYRRVRTLDAGTMVHVYDRSGDWGQVDCNGDGLVDGFVHMSLLREVVS